MMTNNLKTKISNLENKYYRTNSESDNLLSYQNELIDLKKSQKQINRDFKNRRVDNLFDINNQLKYKKILNILILEKKRLQMKADRVGVFIIKDKKIHSQQVNLSKNDQIFIKPNLKQYGKDLKLEKQKPNKCYLLALKEKIPFEYNIEKLNTEKVLDDLIKENRFQKLKQLKIKNKVLKEILLKTKIEENKFEVLNNKKILLNNDLKIFKKRINLIFELEPYQTNQLIKIWDKKQAAYIQNNHKTFLFFIKKKENLIVKNNNEKVIQMKSSHQIKQKKLKTFLNETCGYNDMRGKQLEQELSSLYEIRQSLESIKTEDSQNRIEKINKIVKDLQKKLTNILIYFVLKGFLKEPNFRTSISGNLNEIIINQENLQNNISPCIFENFGLYNKLLNSNRDNLKSNPNSSANIIQYINKSKKVIRKNIPRKKNKISGNSERKIEAKLLEKIQRFDFLRQKDIILVIYDSLLKSIDKKQKRVIFLEFCKNQKMLKLAGIKKNFSCLMDTKTKKEEKNCFDIRKFPEFQKIDSLIIFIISISSSIIIFVNKFIQLRDVIQKRALAFKHDTGSILEDFKFQNVFISKRKDMKEEIKEESSKKSRKTCINFVNFVMLEGKNEMEDFDFNFKDNLVLKNHMKTKSDGKLTLIFDFLKYYKNDIELLFAQFLHLICNYKNILIFMKNPNNANLERKVSTKSKRYSIMLKITNKELNTQSFKLRKNKSRKKSSLFNTLKNSRKSSVSKQHNSKDPLNNKDHKTSELKKKDFFFRSKKSRIKVNPKKSTDNTKKHKGKGNSVGVKQLDLIKETYSGLQKIEPFGNYKRESSDVLNRAKRSQNKVKLKSKDLKGTKEVTVFPKFQNKNSSFKKFIKIKNKNILNSKKSLKSFYQNQLNLKDLKKTTFHQKKKIDRVKSIGFKYYKIDDQFIKYRQKGDSEIDKNYLFKSIFR